MSRGPLDLDSTRLSVLGPLARTVRDAAAFLDAVASRSPATRIRPPPLPPGETFLGWCDRDPGRLRIGRYLESPIAGVSSTRRCARAWEQASALLGRLGHEVRGRRRRRYPPESVPYFETVWAVLGRHAAACPPSREATLRAADPAPARRAGGRDLGAEYADAMAHAQRAARGGSLAATAHSTPC